MRNLKTIICLKSIIFVMVVFFSVSFAKTSFATEYVISTSSSIANKTFEDFYEYSNSHDVYGGVFYVTPKGKLILNNVVFSSNTAMSKNHLSYSANGGAIFNIGTTIINSSIFSENTAVGEATGNRSAYGYGGAICNLNSSTITITSTFFNKNSAIGNGFDGGYGYGGAIANKGGVITINSSIFSENTAIGTGQGLSGYGYGGAIHNEKSIVSTGIITISSSVFRGNVATGKGDGYNPGNGHGGAIYNHYSTTTIKDGTVFENNSARNFGGAIFNNSGTLNLIANTSNVEFTGNTANGISNAIYTSSGTINLWASKNADIIFNDRITSENWLSVLNINSSTTTLTANGQIVLNEDMSGYTGYVNLYDGEIELQAKPNGSNINTNKFFSGNINLSGGTVNILNNTIDSIILERLLSTEKSNLKIDVDLINNTSDNFTVTNNASGVLNLIAINLLGINEDSGQITLFNNDKSPILNVLTTANYGNYVYTFTNNETPGVLNYLLTGYTTLKETVNATEPTIKSYSLSNDEIVTEDLGQLGGTQLTIFGNNKNIEGDNVTGIFVAKDKTLNVEDVNNWSGFNNIYGAIKNEGILNISGTNFSNNVEQDIINNGNLTLAGGTSSFEKGVVGIGTTTINGVNINLTNAVIEQNKIEINNNGSLITKAQNIVGNIENNSNLTFTEGTNENYIYGTGATIINGEVINSSTIVNNVKINEGKQLTTNANDIVGDINNLGNYILNSGTNGNCIYGTGITTINGEVINSSNIVNNIVINETKKLVTNASNINGNISNNGSIEFIGGVINSSISGDNGTVIISSNIVNNSAINQKVIEINNELTNNSSIIAKDIYINGTFKGNLFNATNTIISDGSNIFLEDNKLQNYNFGNLTINSGKLNLTVDVNLENATMDTISANNYNGNGKINIKSFNILTDSNINKTDVMFTSSTILKENITSTTTAYSQLYKYDVIYNNNGYFSFINGNILPEVNPIIFESAIAGMASGLITQVTVLNQAFSSIDNIKNRMTSAKEKGLLYASTADVIFNNGGIESGLWIRPFIAQDTISIDNLDVDNTLTGTLAGIDLATGENSLVSFYLGYAGSNQKYEDIKVNQTGYTVGATGMLIKDNWYAGLTANINFNKAESQSDYGTDSFDLNMYSIGAKAGYNFDLSDKFILEPNLTLMYGSVSNQEYETTQGAKIDSQSNSNIIVEPQVKAKLGLTNGWQPYGLLGYVANISDKGKVVADGTEFETDKIDGYVEYGAGVNKEFINTPWSCYAQVTGRSGGINGVSGNLGVKYKF